MRKEFEEQYKILEQVSFPDFKISSDPFFVQMFMDEWMMCHGIFNASQVSDVDLYLLSDKQEKIST